LTLHFLLSFPSFTTALWIVPYEEDHCLVIWWLYGASEICGNLWQDFQVLQFMLYINLEPQSIDLGQNPPLVGGLFISLALLIPL